MKVTFLSTWNPASVPIPSLPVSIDLSMQYAPFLHACGLTTAQLFRAAKIYPEAGRYLVWSRGICYRVEL